MTTGMERIAALMSGQLPDRVPVCCNLFEQGARFLGLPIEEYYSRSDYVAEAQIRMRNAFDYDFVPVFFYTAQIAEMLGCEEVIYSEIGPPNVGHMVINTYSDIHAFEVPEDISSLAQFQKIEAAMNVVKKEFGGKYPIHTAIVSSFSTPPLLMGIEKWLELLFFGPEAVRNELLEKCSLFQARLTKALFNIGFDMISYSNPVASLDVLTAEQFQKYALPWIKKDMSYHGTANMTYFNGGGRINGLINTLIEEVDFHAFYINPLDDPAEAKTIIAGRGLSTGVINDIKLINWNKNEIEAEVKKILAAGAHGGGFIFGTLVMPYQIPEENIRIMLEAAYKFGDYEGFLKTPS